MSQRGDESVRDTGDKQQQERVAKKQENKRQQLQEDYHALLNSPNGRRVLWDIIAYCKVFETIWDPSAKIHFNSGRQDVGHFVMAQIMKAKPDALTTMMIENNPLAEPK